MSTALVIPCFDEAARLRPERFLAFLETEPGTSLLFVDDGSRDDTAARLDALRQHAKDRIGLERLPGNRGKAEAVRAGVLAALERGCGFVGYWDADLATPLEDAVGFQRTLEAHPECQAVFGARVALLGRPIERSALRHYAGRVQATLVSTWLGLPVYDAQCGAKLFRATPDVARLFAEPFVSRWLFDVEIVARLARLRADADIVSREIREMPVSAWHDVPGSKVGLRAYARSVFDFGRMARAYPRFRGRASRG